MEDAKHKLLIIDDDPDQLMVFQMFFKKNGFEVFTVEGGRQALDFLNGQSVDLILCDLNMPEMDGMEFISRFRKTEPETATPIIALSAGRLDDAEELVAAGANAFAEKKDIRKLLERLQSFLG